MKKTAKTKVVFRIWPKSEGCGVIAIFPRDCGTNDPATCSSYMHVGQHSACDPQLLTSLRLATRDEYAALKRELEHYGPADAHYKLDVRTRCTRADYEERKRRIAAMSIPAKLTVIGEYNRDGYTVQTIRAGKIIAEYSAGNSQHDSGQHEADPAFSRPLSKMRKSCISTGREIAAEKGATFGGVQRIDDETPDCSEPVGQTPSKAQ